MRTQRIQDPICGLIAFRDEDATDTCAWELINTHAFQRLRRIRQLGLADFVFPGATHSRFAHGVGVFDTARRLLKIIHRRLGDAFDEDRARIAALAALLHDIGHGPLSHAFERQAYAVSHETWSARIIREDKEILGILGKDTADAIASIIAQDAPADIYGAVVSSQFDADRLDYLRRDRMMTGVRSGGFDFAWLLDCLDVGEIPPHNTESLYVSHKGVRNLEEYLLARYYLYTNLYTHKTTRAAETMLIEILGRIVATPDATGLDSAHPLTRYYASRTPALEDYLALDDATLWNALVMMVREADKPIAHLAQRFLARDLYKCFDAGALARNLAAREDTLVHFRNNLKQEEDALIDENTISAYGIYALDTDKALEKIMVGLEGSRHKADIADVSPVIRALPEERLFRVYVPDEKSLTRIEALWKKAASA